LLAEQEGYAIDAIWTDRAPVDLRRHPALVALRKAVASGDIGMVTIPTLANLGMRVEEAVAFIVELYRVSILLTRPPPLASLRDPATITDDGGKFRDVLAKIDETRSGFASLLIRMGDDRPKRPSRGTCGASRWVRQGSAGKCASS
jgi:hypothetical protein